VQAVPRKKREILPETHLKVSTPRRLYEAIDLFSGCGGLSYGLANSGIHAKSAVDNWPEALATYEANHLGSSIIDFYISRKLGRDYVKTYIEKRGGKIEKFDKIIGYS
jgi:DNA (cytosine-5)-methyltransferase 1